MLEIGRYLVVLVLVLELWDHGDGVFGLRVVDDSNVKPIERHERHLAGKLLLVHLLQDLSADLKIQGKVKTTILGQTLITISNIFV